MFSKSFSSLKEYVADAKANKQGLLIQIDRLYKGKPIPDNDLVATFTHASTTMQGDIIECFFEDEEKINKIGALYLRYCAECAAKAANLSLVKKILSKTYTWGKFFYFTGADAKERRYSNDLNFSSSGDGQNILACAVKSDSKDIVEYLLKLDGQISIDSALMKNLDYNKLELLKIIMESEKIDKRNLYNVLNEILINNVLDHSIKYRLEQTSAFSCTLETFNDFYKNNLKLLALGGQELYQQIVSISKEFDPIHWLKDLPKQLPIEFFDEKYMPDKATLSDLRRLYFLLNTVFVQPSFPIGKPEYLQWKQAVKSCCSSDKWFDDIKNLARFTTENLLKTQLNNPIANLFLGLFFEKHFATREKYLIAAGPLFWGLYFNEAKIKILLKDAQQFKPIPKAVVADDKKDVKTPAASASAVEQVVKNPAASVPEAQSQPKPCAPPLEGNPQAIVQNAKPEGLQANDAKKTDQQRISELENEVDRLKTELTLVKEDFSKLIKSLDINSKSAAPLSFNLFALKPDVVSDANQNDSKSKGVEPA